MIVHPLSPVCGFFAHGAKKPVANNVERCSRGEQSELVNNCHRRKRLLVLNERRNEENLQRHALCRLHLMRGGECVDGIVQRGDPRRVVAASATFAC